MTGAHQMEPFETLLKGTLSEWGLPPARQGRRYLVSLLGKSSPLTLWIYQGDTQVYPPAWSALGVNLRKIYFAKASNPLTELQPVFLESLFKVIVLDGFNNTKKSDLAFLSQRARMNQQAILILRNYFLTSNYGNPHARLRVNCHYSYTRRTYTTQVIKGSETTKKAVLS